ncbi:hypothetical protein GCM10019059_30170 [Camelimonas fluminis]|uniref:Adenylate/guanylate cyclase domain-containing protein n=1 Tax=Camelimonas fluminis TaxID=1576911 RepID=A0ABV7UK19_9HYPH|nr:hypothetical protein GCM10019059_30170 [Camelimonas fluminis]
MEAISRATLSALAGCDETRLSELERLGILRQRNGSYHSGDVSCLRVALALNDAGISLDTLAEGLSRKVFSLDFASQLMFEPVALTTRSLDRELQAENFDLPTLNRLRSATGLPQLSDDQAPREDDIELMQQLAACRRLGVSEEGLARVLRVFGQTTRRAVDTMRDLFRGEIEEQLLGSGLSHAEMLEIGARKRLALQRSGFRGLFLLQRRLLEEAVFNNVVARIQDAFRDEGHEIATGEAMPAVAFADLTGFTSLTDMIGDSKAAEQAAAFEAFAQKIALAVGGRVIKALGDGVMMLFPDAACGLEASLLMIEEQERHGLPPVRVGLATGQIVPRDGDIFGRTVNLAARISNVAQAAEVLACPATRTSALAMRPLSFSFSALKPVGLKGLREPVPLFSVHRAAAGDGGMPDPEGTG